MTELLERNPDTFTVADILLKVGAAARAWDIDETQVEIVFGSLGIDKQTPVERTKRLNQIYDTLTGLSGAPTISSDFLYAVGKNFGVTIDVD